MSFAAQQEAVDDIRAMKWLKSFNVVEKRFEEPGEAYEAYGFRACTIG